MAKKDPNVTARNAWIKDLSAELNSLLPQVLLETGIESKLSLNAIIGSKHDKYFDLRNDVLVSPDEFVTRWFAGLNKYSSQGHGSSIAIQKYINTSQTFLEYAKLFLKRSFLNYFHEWSRVRPSLENAIMWLGQNNAEYGLLVTPRFSNGQWENDKSEIRAVPFNYWTIGHVLSTGLVVPSRGDGKVIFNTVEDYLFFFETSIVRRSGSKYENEIASYYRDFVLSHDNNKNIPLLIPEYRYGGLDRKHVYRLDFTIINPYTQDRNGIELSPWSSHGYLSKTKNMSQSEINDIAKNNFATEMKKHRDYFQQRGIFVLIYTDENLVNCKDLFERNIVPLLTPAVPKPVFPFDIARRYSLV